jgi:hypothetical protein
MPFVIGMLAPSHPATHVRDDRETPLQLERDARERAFDLPDGTSEVPATRWHEGQISSRRKNRVN